MVKLRPYPRVFIYRPPPPPPDWLPLQVRSALATLFLFVSVVFIAASVAPEPESDRIRKLWQQWGYAPPPTGRDVTVIPGKLRFLAHDPRTNRIAFATSERPLEIWDTVKGKPLAASTDKVVKSLTNQIDVTDAVISKQFGNCYVWSANEETRIAINRDPEDR